MVWAWTDEFPDVHGAYDDPDEANRMLRLWLAGWERWRCLAEDFVVAGDRVVVLVRYRGRGHGSGLELEAPAAHVWTMRGPKAARLDVYMDRGRALREAGVAG
jgi:ketosteroid isomerase-like protein